MITIAFINILLLYSEYKILIEFLWTNNQYESSQGQLNK